MAQQRKPNSNRSLKTVSPVKTDNQTEQLPGGVALFFGQAGSEGVPKDSISAEAFIFRLEGWAALYNWEEERTARVAFSHLRGKAKGLMEMGWNEAQRKANQVKILNKWGTGFRAQFKAWFFLDTKSGDMLQRWSAHSDLGKDDIADFMLKLALKDQTQTSTSTTSKTRETKQAILYLMREAFIAGQARHMLWTDEEVGTSELRKLGLTEPPKGRADFPKYRLKKDFAKQNPRFVCRATRFECPLNCSTHKKLR